MKSKIDGKEYERNEFLKHLRAHKLTLKDYYVHHEKRRDLLTRKLLTFTDESHYLNSFFENRQNMLAYFQAHPSFADLAKVIQGRKCIKNLQFAPSTIEARTSILPTPVLVQRMGFDYNQLCESVGLKARYDYALNPTFYNGPLEIIQDTREQNPLQLLDVTVSKLEVGDYACRNRFNDIFVERKSLNDFCGTMSLGFDRFKREIERAKSINAHLIVLVEEKLLSLTSAKTFPSNSYIKGSPDFYLTRMRTLCETCDNIQFVFTDSRLKSAEIIPSIFRIEQNVKKIDLQFILDKGMI